MKEKVKSCLYALLIGTYNAIICGVFLSFYLFSIDRNPYFGGPHLVFLSLFLLPPFFCIQFWITSLIIVFLIDKFSGKINPNWIVFAGSYISSFIVARFAMFGPIIQSVMNGEYGWFGYMGITVFIYLFGFHLLFRNPNSTPAKTQEIKDSLAIYFHSFRIAAINGIFCGIILPVYQNHKWKLFDVSDSPILIVLYILMFVFSFVVQFSLTSLLITIIVLRLKKINHSYIIIFAMTLLSVLVGRNLFMHSTGFATISEGDYSTPIYFLITLSIYLLGYRRLFKKNNLNNHNSKALPEEARSIT